MSPAKKTALIDLLPRWSLADPGTGSTDPLVDPPSESLLRAAFGRGAPRLLDVGVGTGEATLAWAQDHPDHDVVAVELHRPGLARMLQALDDGGPSNVRILETDVTRLLDAMAAARRADDAPPFTGVRVLFPDPWPKARHRSRRLVDRSFVSTVADLLPPGGWLHLATDWDGYALQMVHALLDEPRFRLEADPVALAQVAAARAAELEQHQGQGHGPGPGPGSPASADATRPTAFDGQLPWSSARPPRPVTTYEQRGIQAGRRVTDLVARRSDD